MTGDRSFVSSHLGYLLFPVTSVGVQCAEDVIHLSILGIGYESLTVMTFSFRYSMQNLILFSPIFYTNTIRLGHSAYSGWITPSFKILYISWISAFRAFGPTRYGL